MPERYLDRTRVICVFASRKGAYRDAPLSFKVGSSSGLTMERFFQNLCRQSDAKAVLLLTVQLSLAVRFFLVTSPAGAYIGSELRPRFREFVRLVLLRRFRRLAVWRDVLVYVS